MPHGVRGRSARVSGRSRRARMLAVLLGVALAACSDGGPRESVDPRGDRSPDTARAGGLGGRAARSARERSRGGRPRRTARRVAAPRIRRRAGGRRRGRGLALLRRSAARRQRRLARRARAGGEPRSIASRPPPPASCAGAASDGAQRLSFATAGAGIPAFVRYDRRDPRATAPFPDDFWLPRRAADGDHERASGDRSHRLPRALAVAGLGLRRPASQGLDGFSPIAHLTVELSEAPDLASLPRTPAGVARPARVGRPLRSDAGLAELRRARALPARGAQRCDRTSPAEPRAAALSLAVARRRAAATGSS